jgi:hypothetical protein
MRSLAVKKTRIKKQWQLVTCDLFGPWLGAGTEDSSNVFVRCPALSSDLILANLTV